MKEHLFDKRVVQRALQEGLLKQDDYQRMLDALPDLSDRLQTSDLDDEPDPQDDEPRSESAEASKPSAFSPEL